MQQIKSPEQWFYLLFLCDLAEKKQIRMPAPEEDSRLAAFMEHYTSASETCG